MIQLGDQNPITIQVFKRKCSAQNILQLQQALVMSMSVVFVMVCGNMIISALRNVIPSRIRIIVQLVVVSSLVVFVDQCFTSFFADVQEKLSRILLANCFKLYNNGTFRSICSWKYFVAIIFRCLLETQLLLMDILINTFFTEIIWFYNQLFGYQVFPDAWYEAGGFI